MSSDKRVGVHDWAVDLSTAADAYATTQLVKGKPMLAKG